MNAAQVLVRSLERVHQYITIEQEPQDGKQPPAYWPSSGDLHVERLSAAYSMVRLTICNCPVRAVLNHPYVRMGLGCCKMSPSISRVVNV